jgi:hypothetical protein
MKIKKRFVGLALMMTVTSLEPNIYYGFNYNDGKSCSLYAQVSQDKFLIAEACRLITRQTLSSLARERGSSTTTMIDTDSFISSVSARVDTEEMIAELRGELESRATLSDDILGGVFHIALQILETDTTGEFLQFFQANPQIVASYVSFKAFCDANPETLSSEANVEWQRIAQKARTAGESCLLPITSRQAASAILLCYEAEKLPAKWDAMCSRELKLACRTVALRWLNRRCTSFPDWLQTIRANKKEDGFIRKAAELLQQRDPAPFLCFCRARMDLSIMKDDNEFDEYTIANSFGFSCDKAANGLWPWPWVQTFDDGAITPGSRFGQTQPSKCSAPANTSGSEKEQTTNAHERSDVDKPDTSEDQKNF